MSVEVRPLSAVPVQSIAALCTACLVFSAVPPPGHSPAHVAPTPVSPTVALTAQALPLPLDLLNQQVVFNVGLTLNFLATGAALAQRITQVPGSFASDVGSGTPLPAAAAQALTAFADIEFEAGRDLIGYAQDIADFQLQFRATTLSAFPPFTAGPGQQFIVASTAFGLTIVQQLVNFALAVVTSAQQFTHNALGTPPPAAPTNAAIAPKISALQQHSASITLSTPTPQQHLAAIKPVSHTRTGHLPDTHQSPTHQTKGTHRH